MVNVEQSITRERRTGSRSWCPDRDERADFQACHAGINQRLDTTLLVGGRKWIVDRLEFIAWCDVVEDLSRI